MHECSLARRLTRAAVTHHDNNQGRIQDFGKGGAWNRQCTGGVEKIYIKMYRKIGGAHAGSAPPWIRPCNRVIHHILHQSYCLSNPRIISSTYLHNQGTKAVFKLNMVLLSAVNIIYISLGLHPQLIWLIFTLGYQYYIQYMLLVHEVKKIIITLAILSQLI